MASQVNFQTIKNLLVTHFMENPILDVSNEVGFYKMLVGDTVKSEVTEAVLRQALKDLAVTGIITAVTDNVYMLSKPLGSFFQDVKVSAVAAEMIADILEKTSDHEVDKNALHSNDISMLCGVCYELMAKLENPDVATEGDN